MLQLPHSLFSVIPPVFYHHHVTYAQKATLSLLHSSSYIPHQPSILAHHPHKQHSDLHTNIISLSNPLLPSTQLILPNQYPHQAFHHHSIFTLSTPHHRPPSTFLLSPGLRLFTPSSCNLHALHPCNPQYPHIVPPLLCVVYVQPAIWGQL